MKPGMQRDLLVAYWLLFDEFAVADDDPALHNQGGGDRNAPANTRKNNGGEKLRVKNNKARRGPQKSSP
jgi:hypothetical protein